MKVTITPKRAKQLLMLPQRRGSMSYHFKSNPPSLALAPAVEGAPAADRRAGAGAPSQPQHREPQRAFLEYCGLDGPIVLKAKIEAYWRERGHIVTVSLHDAGFAYAIRTTRVDIRSDLVNGLPAKKLALRGPA